jgi:F0F1-type ATP synthase gamma subunit
MANTLSLHDALPIWQETITKEICDITGGTEAIKK